MSKIQSQDLLGPAPNFAAGSILEAQTYFESPYYAASYDLPYNPDPLARGNNYKIYDEMRDDDQVKVALSFKNDFIVNSGWQIECDNIAVKEFVERALKTMQEDGSLQMSFEDTLRDIQGSAYSYGFAMAEPVFRIQGGRYGFDSIRVRPPQSFKFRVTPKGDVTEVIQSTAKGEIRFDPQLFLHHVYQVEYGNPYGKSDLRGAHNAWKAKKFVTKFLAVYLERFATPTVVGRYPQEWDSDEVSKLQNVLKTIQQATTLAVPEGAQIEFIQANRDSSDTYIRALDYYNMHIARALLVPDLMGISGEKTGGGSYSLGQDQFKMFQATIDKDRMSLARKVTLRIVAPLARANFGPGIKCEFKFIPYSMDSQTELLKIWASVVTGNVFKPTPEEINHLRRQLKFPEGPVELGTPEPKPFQSSPVPSAPPAPQRQMSQRRVVRKTEFAGLPINIEIDRGQEKSGIGPDGKEWSHIYTFPYGEIARTEGEDGDAVDVYLGPDEDAKQVYVVHQNDQRGKFDEDKIFLGFPSQQAAEKAYRDHGPSWGFGSMDEMTPDEFKNGYLASNRKFTSKQREFTEAEKKVDFAQIKRALDEGESALSRGVKRAAAKIWKGYLSQIAESGLVDRFDPARLTDLEPKHLRDMNQELKHGFRDLMEQARDEAKRELFPEKKFGLEEGELDEDDMQKVLDAEAFNITKDYKGLVSKEVNSSIIQGLKQGLSHKQIMDKIRSEMPDLTDRWINTLIRTKTTEIYNRGRKSYFDNDEMAQQVIGGYQFSAILDARTSQICRSLDKTVYATDDPNANLMTPPLHFNAIVMGEKVRTRRGDVAIEGVRRGDYVWTHMGRWKRVYDVMGKLNDDFDYVLRLGNGETRVLLTPDHPILSDGHWTAAGDLRVGEHIAQAREKFCGSSRTECGGIAKAEHPVSFGSEHREAGQGFLLPCGFTPLTNLNQDVPDAKVNHPGADYGLGVKGYFGILQHFRKALLGLRWMCAEILGHAQRHPLTDPLIPRRVIGTHARAVGGVHRTSFLPFPELPGNKIWAGTKFPEGQARPLSLSSSLNPEFPTPIREGVHTGQPQRMGNRSERFQFTPMALRNHGVESGGVVDVHVKDCSISTAVKSIEKVAYSGMVYNLAIEDDESYVVNGIVVHNCRSVIVPVTRYEKSTLREIEDVPKLEKLQDMGANLLAEESPSIRNQEHQCADVGGGEIK